MNITAGTYVFSLLYVLEPGVMVYIPILTVFFLTALGKPLCNFVFPFPNMEGYSVCQWKTLWSLCINQISINSLYYYLNEIGLV